MIRASSLGRITIESAYDERDGWLYVEFEAEFKADVYLEIQLWRERFDDARGERRPRVLEREHAAVSRTMRARAETTYFEAEQRFEDTLVLCVLN